MAIKTMHRSVRTPQEHYKVLDEALTNLLRASKAQVSQEMMGHLIVFDRCLRSALGLPIEMDG